MTNPKTSSGDKPISIEDILDPILIKMYWNGRTDVAFQETSGQIPAHAEAVKNNWLKDTKTALINLIQDIGTELIGEDIKRSLLDDGWGEYTACSVCEMIPSEDDERSCNCTIQNELKATQREQLQLIIRRLSE